MNLFLPVYQRLEKEVIDLSHYIFFNEKQKNVYSLAIADIIIRCAVEIEAIAKALYLQLGGDPEPKDKDGNKRDLYFDTDCMQKLVDEWSLDKKKLKISNSNMYFEGKQAIITPLKKANKRGSSGALWNRDYQSIKHNRTQNLHRATVWSMLNTLGALYILNLYYAKKRISSEIFIPDSFDGTHISMSIYMGDGFNKPIDREKADRCCFVDKITEEAFSYIHRSYCRAQVITIYEIMKTKRFEKSLEEHSEYQGKTIKLIQDYFKEEAHRIQKRELINDHVFAKVHETEEVIWKGQQLYPDLSYEEYLYSEDGRQLKEALGIPYDFLIQ